MTDNYRLFKPFFLMRLSRLGLGTIPTSAFGYQKAMLAVVMPQASIIKMQFKQEFAEGVVKVHIKKLTALLIVICASMFLTSCAGRYSSEEFWGSYSSDRTFSYDHKLYANQTVDDSMIVVTIYNAETNAEIYSFSPARASDFWGICWEKDSYNIWIQSADIGEYCFEYKNEKWTRNESLTPPNYIISKYDEKYKNNSALWENIYHSPKE